MKLPNGYGSVSKNSGNRRRPWLVRKTIGWHYDPKKGKQVRETLVVGYARTRKEGLQMLADYNNCPIDADMASMRFRDVYNRWSRLKYKSISKSSIESYTASYAALSCLHDKKFRNIKLIDIQNALEKCDKNYPMLKKIKVLLSQLYEYAINHEICNKDYSKLLDLSPFKQKNPNKREPIRFDNSELDSIWHEKDDKYYQTILMLIYSGVRVCEMLNLLKEDVCLEDQYFHVRHSKTENGIRIVPIADCVLPFWRNWYESNPSCPYVIYNAKGEHFTYNQYYKQYFKPRMTALNISKTPHCSRHTCTSLLAEAEVDRTIRDKIIGHTSNMSLSERVYTHLDNSVLLSAINKIRYPEDL